MSQTENKYEKLRESWKKHIAEFRSSGMTTREWCNTHNLSITKLRYWLRKYKDQDLNNYKSTSETQWLPLKVDNTNQVEPETSQMTVKVGQASIKVGPNFDSQLLKDLVRTLSELC
ncbi:IS66 family insertion sequence element accessory protein TnpA [Natranaerobius trueperi]|uniref:Transposase n=2 Tax=Natranaerobius trueperi TaxID=759412 RepID=A0A226C057_9FIRM|nr:transposase [Natranaerobius trueperi]OWZ84678.1 transposase [Natranaerobius trueperi]